jgi:hypothetical protein
MTRWNLFPLLKTRNIKNFYVKNKVFDFTIFHQGYVFFLLQKCSANFIAKTEAVHLIFAFSMHKINQRTRMQARFLHSSLQIYFLHCSYKIRQSPTVEYLQRVTASASFGAYKYCVVKVTFSREKLVKPGLFEDILDIQYYA